MKALNRKGNFYRLYKSLKNHFRTKTDLEAEQYYYSGNPKLA